MPIADEKETESFKRATAAAIKAIGHCRELEVAFGQGSDSVTPQRVSLPELSDKLDSTDRACARGRADAAAVRLRYHDPSINAAHAPLQSQAAALMATLEQSRCEALGAQRMSGIEKNIAAFLTEQCRQKHYHTAKTQAEVPLADMLHLLAHEAFCDTPLPEQAEHAVSLWRPLIGERLTPHFKKLKKLLHDQKAFTEEVNKLLVTLELAERPKKKKKDDTSETQEDTPNEAPS
ncbi:MAG: hypothetical protein AB7E52_07245, partial [Bdellovibrionales bacterium]